MTEHSGAYHDWAISLNELGWAVVSHDHPGSGLTLHPLCQRNELPKNAIDILLSAVDRVDQWIQTQYSGLKVVRYGHSMGSFIAMCAEQKLRHSAGLILTGSTMGAPLVLRLQDILLTILATFLPKIVWQKWGD